VIVAGCLIVGMGTTAFMQRHSHIQKISQEGEPVTSRATETFEVKLTPQAPDKYTQGMGHVRTLRMAKPTR
jgi:hypothetical protein